MINITLPDGRVLSFEKPLAVKEIAAAIGPKLAKAALAAKINEQLVDLSYQVTTDANCRILTAKDQDGLDILRHSTAHLLAQAVTELFPGVQVTVGPAVENGFYHDFYYPAGFSENDLVRIEERMHKLATADLPIVRSIKTHDEARDYFAKRQEQYKVMMIDDISDSEVSFYTQGDFTNACRGPHVPSTGYLKYFKLTKLSGAYWKGDAKNEMLQRIYGTAWGSEQELRSYLERLERAKQSDHRLIGKKMDLFHLQDEAPGIVFWHPHGWTIYSTIRNYLTKKLQEFGYQEVNTPIIIDRVLWERSGHWENYHNAMFITESENHIYAVKPMNCPGEVQIFRQGLKSYRDLPIRYCEFGYCHRNEVSGSLHGIMRVRGFTQDDGHIFCTSDQICDEAYRYIDQVMEVYQRFGFTKDRVTTKLSTRPAERIGTDEIWDKAEEALATVLDKYGLTWELSPGEGAFYGPKIEFSLKDSLERVWQCGTLQVDFFMPSRLGATYIDADGEKKHPIMLHRAMVGSLERFIGILLEETAGYLPLWLAPVQAVVIGITDAQLPYVTEVVQKLKAQGLRVIADTRNEKVGFKIREHSIARVPYILVVGAHEVENGTVAVRTARGEDLGEISVEKLLTEVMIDN